MVETRLGASGDVSRDAVADGAFKVRGLRWWIVSLIFLATLINYVDRLTISVLAPVIMQDLGLTNTEFGGIVVWFLLAYTISQGVSGKLYDRVGTRRGFTFSIVIWSAAAAAHAFARGLASLSALRFVLGFGEAGNWPGAAKAVAEWFPVRQRALGMAIFNSGAAIGSVVAPPLIIWLQLRYGWQTTFLVTGALGIIWLMLWLAFYQTPDRHRWITVEERTLIREAPEVESRTEEATTKSLNSNAAPRWRDLLRHRQVWAIVLARFFTDPVWWLYITWLPLYLYTARGFSLKEIGLFAWVPYVAADAGSLFGGWFSGYLISCGWSVDRARKTVIAVAALLMPAGIFAAFAESPFVSLALIALVLFGFQVWINNVQTLPSDFFPRRAVGSVAGLGGTGAGIGAMLFTLTTGWVVDHFSYVPVLVAAGVLAPLGTLVLFALAGPIRRVGLS
ncbi:MAG: transporter, family, hexuronate transporter [Acidobacteriota bacterium]|jgi:ACS family hexuronate transporter-like MFS transporter|nr:transporter, family, hexuronate transporter [Acidobacteriota bacterium]